MNIPWCWGRLIVIDTGGCADGSLETFERRASGGGLEEEAVGRL